MHIPLYPFKVYNFVWGFCVIVELYDYHHCLILKHLHHLNKKPFPHEQSLLIPPAQPLAATHAHPVSVAIDFPVLDIS